MFFCSVIQATDSTCNGWIANSAATSALGQGREAERQVFEVLSHEGSIVAGQPQLRAGGGDKACEFGADLNGDRNRLRMLSPNNAAANRGGLSGGNLLAITLEIEALDLLAGDTSDLVEERLVALRPELLRDRGRIDDIRDEDGDEPSLRVCAHSVFLQLR